MNEEFDRLLDHQWTTNSGMPIVAKLACSPQCKALTSYIESFRKERKHGKLEVRSRQILQRAAAQNGDKREHWKWQQTSCWAIFVARSYSCLEELRSELEKHGREVAVYKGAEFASIRVTFQDSLEFEYRVKTIGLRVYPETLFKEKRGKQTYKSEGSYSAGQNTFQDITKAVIINHFLEDYKRQVSWPG